MNSSRENKIILLVDDEEDIRDVLYIALSDLGYDVHTAENGKQALDIFQKIRPPIVLTDIKMPVMDGIELLKIIRHQNPDTEVIMITGHGDMDLAIKSLKHEAADFITKPINVNALKIALKRVHDKILMKRKLKEYTQGLETLIREKVELQDRLASLGMMIGSISHGIKGLLTNLDGGIYFLNSGLRKNDQEQTKDGLEVVQQTTECIKKLVLDILFYAKERELKTELVDIPGFAKELADAAQQKIRGKNIKFITQVNDAPQEFFLDADFLRTALINIFDNAIDACSDDMPGKSHTILFIIKQDKEELVIEIHDTGMGMDSETREKIFDLFFSSKGSKGTGFGLFISNNIVNQHKGTIKVRSAKGKGTQFFIRLPKPDRYI